MALRNYLTIDVEDYFQVSAFEDVISREDWPSLPSRVVRNTHRILDLLDRKNVRATFFILGWTAEKHPELAREICARRHEVGCHSYSHRLVYSLTPETFLEDTRKAKEIIEQITGKPVTGYRAPSYSITTRSLWALEILAGLGFRYDSSIFPIRHDIYGIPDAPRFSYRIKGSDLVEYPLTTTLFLGKNIPIAGGGYFRLFPYWFTRRALQGINEHEKKPFVFYLHPWEIDPGQPRIRGARLKSRLRHYLNLEKNRQKFEKLLDDFSFGPIGAASD